MDRITVIAGGLIITSLAAMTLIEKAWIQDLQRDNARLKMRVDLWKRHMEYATSLMTPDQLIEVMKFTANESEFYNIVAEEI